MRSFTALMDLALALTALRPAIWLPSEALATKSIGPITVYVLNESFVDLVYWDADNYTVLRMPRSNITYRRYCINPRIHQR